MTAAEIIQRFDEDRKNTISDDKKLRWLQEVERVILDETILTHVLPRKFWGKDLRKYFDDWGMESEMLAPPPWDELYIHYLDRKMAWMQKETKYLNMATSLYDNAMLSFNGWYNRTHKPIHIAHPWLRHERL